MSKKKETPKPILTITIDIFKEQITCKIEHVSNEPINLHEMIGVLESVKQDIISDIKNKKVKTA